MNYIAPHKPIAPKMNIAINPLAIFFPIDAVDHLDSSCHRNQLINECELALPAIQAFVVAFLGKVQRHA
jgi:hypothetical protein